jgi:hypothetical protein
MKIQKDWLILAFIALFLTIPLSTLPGLFSIVGVLIGLITLVIVVLLVLSALQGRGQAE